MDIKKIAIVGAGEMGHGIAEVFSLAGFPVSLIDIKPDVLKAALSNISDSLDKLSKKGIITAQHAKDSLKRITTYTDVTTGAKDADVVVEAVPENIDLKVKIFKQLAQVTRNDTVLCSNTSNIRITDIAKDIKNPERVVGTHFFNPPVLMKLVEVVRGEKTSDAVFNDILGLIKNLGKTPIGVNKDAAGFIVNRINAPEMLFFGLLIDKKVAKPEEVDSFIRSQGLPMGPYELFDFVGVDVVNSSLLYYAKEISPDFGKAKVYSDLVKNNLLGKKTGKGFYDWGAGRPKIIDSAKPTDKVALLDIFALEINEAVKLIEAGIASPDDIETAVKLGMNRPFGPISVAKNLANGDVKDKLDALAKQFDCKIFEPADSIKQGKMREAVESRLSAKKTVPNAAVQPTKPAEFKNVTIQKPGGKVAILSLNRPRLNLINDEVLEELDRAIMALWSDAEVNVVVVRGEGGVLSAGADLSTYFANDLQFVEFSKKGQKTFAKFSEIPKITIAAIEGYALGGGFELALACDIRISTSAAVLGFPEITHGLLPAWGGSQRISKLAGVSVGSRLVLTGERITGKEAFDLRIVSKLFDADFASGALSYAKEIASTVAPIAVALSKVLINKGFETPLEAGLEVESSAFGLLFNTDDLKEGLSSFLQKRKPEFKGK